MTILTSIRGRLLGLDKDNRLETPRSFRTNNVTAASTASNIKNDGITTLGSTAQPTFLLDAPVAGCRKTLVATSASTGTIVSSTASGATFNSTNTGTSTKATFLSIGQALHLEGLSTALWGVVGNYGSVAFSS